MSPRVGIIVEVLFILPVRSCGWGEGCVLFGFQDSRILGFQDSIPSQQGSGFLGLAYYRMGFFFLRGWTFQF